MTLLPKKTLYVPRHGTTAEIAAATSPINPDSLAREVAVDTTKAALVVMNRGAPGGIAMAREDLDNVDPATGRTRLNVDIAGTAAALIAAHLAAGDPHPQYITAGELAAALAPYLPSDADLVAIASLATLAYGRSLLTLADKYALRVSAGLKLGLGPYDLRPGWARHKSNGIADPHGILNLVADDFIADANGKPSFATFSRASAATCIDATGKLVSCVSGVLRHDFDPATGAYLGWLIEPSATNLAWYNCAPAAFAGPTGLENVTVAAAADPLGTNLALALTENNVNSEHRLRLDGFGNSYTLNANTSYVISAMVKAGPGTRGVKLSLGNASAAEIQINPATGAAQTRLVGAGFTSITAPTVVQNPGGWWDVSSVALVAGSNLTSCNFVPALTSTQTNWTSNYAGDNASGNVLFGWGVVAGTARSSLILTPSNAAVTRAADVLTVPTSAFALNAREGTLLVRGDAKDVAVVPAVLHGTGGDFIAFDIQAPNQVRGVVAAGGPVVVSLVTAGFSPNVVFTAALAYRHDDYALSTNGSAPTTDTSASVPAVTSLHIGAFNGGSFLQGHIRQIAYFPRRLPDAELQDITR